MNTNPDPSHIQQQWEASMKRRLEELRQSIRQDTLEALAARSGGSVVGDKIVLTYWQQRVGIAWADLTARDEAQGKKLSLFDTLMLLYYLHTADGTPQADRWVSFRELPGGAFYHQAFQGYSGNRLLRSFEDRLDGFQLAARTLRGIHLTGIGEFAYGFDILPRLRLAAILWPGDDEIPGKGSILFDAAASHYMVLDGLAILGSRLVSRLEKSRS